MSQDLSLARQLDTPWREIFKNELQSSDIEVVRGWLSTSLVTIEQQDRSIGRLKAAFCASLFAIIGLWGHIWGVLQRGWDSTTAETGNTDPKYLQTLPVTTTEDEKLRWTIDYYIEQRKKEWAEDPVEYQLKRLRQLEEK